MNIDYISKKFLDRSSVPEGKYKKFSVLIPLISINNKIHLVFEVRSEKLNTQPGEICFPGGGIEENESPSQCAIRETSEELNIQRENIELLGECDYIVTPFNLILYPFVGLLKNICIEDINFNKDEVGSIFTVPLDFFVNTPPEVYNMETIIDVSKDFPFEKIQNGKGYNWRTGRYPILFYQYNNYVIWGMTARIIKNFIDIIAM